MNRKTMDVHVLTGVAIFTAVVVVLQLLGAFIRFGPFSISLVLIPIVVGAALYGPAAGAWLGFVFSVVVLFTDSGAFLVVNAVATIAVVLVKGTAAGWVAGLVFTALEKKNTWLAVICAAIVCPVVNTGLFLVGCQLFFLPTITEWAKMFGFENAGRYMIFGLVGSNFLFEVLFNIIFSPLILRLIRIGRKEKA
jgi:thiamine transporter ThiT